jgi:hypothetical protein
VKDCFLTGIASARWGLLLIHFRKVISITLCLIPKELVNSMASLISPVGIYGVLIVIPIIFDFLNDMSPVQKKCTVNTS